MVEEDGEVVFLHRIVPGGADRSYGVYVARLAGMPSAVVNRAWEVLTELEGKSSTAANGRSDPPSTQAQQLSLLPTTPPVIDELLALDVSSLTPLEAITKLYEIQERAR